MHPDDDVTPRFQWNYESMVRLTAKAWHEIKVLRRALRIMEHDRTESSKYALEEAEAEINARFAESLIASLKETPMQGTPWMEDIMKIVERYVGANDKCHFSPSDYNRCYEAIDARIKAHVAEHIEQVGRLNRAYEIVNRALANVAGELSTYGLYANKHPGEIMRKALDEAERQWNLDTEEPCR